MEKDLPKIDIPGNVIVGTNVSKEILSLYTDFPCRLKAGVFVLCMGGHLEASIDLTRYQVSSCDFISVLPDSILQIHKAEGDIQIYFIGFSSEFLRSVNLIKLGSEFLYLMRERPVLSLLEKNALFFQDYFNLLLKAQELEFLPNKEIAKNILISFLCGLGEVYKKMKPEDVKLVKGKKTEKDFAQLVMQHYAQERAVAFYAQKLGITPSHLSTTIKQITGKTCIDIISAMVIMDAKVQLKSTDLPIQEIAYSLNFTNMSFFGKYFKRYVGMGPLEYRNS